MHRELGFVCGNILNFKGNLDSFSKPRTFAPK